MWHGTLIGAITAGTLGAMSRRSAQARYGVACLALAAMLVAFAATFSVALGYAASAEHQATGAEVVKVDAVAEMAGPARLRPVTVDTRPPPLDWWLAVATHRRQDLGWSALPPEGSWLGAAWLAGAAIVALSSVFQFAALRRLTASARFEIRDGWRDAFESIARDLRLEQLARLGHSAAVEVPTVFGWLAPVVLVPLSSCIPLSRDEMRAILAHELAHIRRRDYLVNVVQKVVEALLFFHPATWWLSRRIRVEREYCCDDVAVHYTNSALVYARALSQLETLRAQRRHYAMSADGGSLMNRIARIVGTKPEGRRVSIIGGGLGALVVAMIGMAFVLVDNASAEPGTPDAIVAVGPANAGPMASLPDFVQLVPGFLNLDPSVFAQQLSTGKTLAQVAEAHGKTQAQLTDFLVARVSEQLAQALKAGAITAAQAEEMKQGLTAGISQLVMTPLSGPMARQEQGGPLGVFDLVPGFLDLDQAVIQAEFGAGKSLGQVAEAHGKTRAELQTFLVEQFSARLDQLVKDGHVPAAAASQMRQQFTTAVGQLLMS